MKYKFIGGIMVKGKIFLRVLIISLIVESMILLSLPVFNATEVDNLLEKFTLTDVENMTAEELPQEFIVMDEQKRCYQCNQKWTLVRSTTSKNVKLRWHPDFKKEAIYKYDTPSFCVASSNNRSINTSINFGGKYASVSVSYPKKTASTKCRNVSSGAYKAGYRNARLAIYGNKITRKYKIVTTTNTGKKYTEYRTYYDVTNEKEKIVLS